MSVEKMNKTKEKNNKLYIQMFSIHGLIRGSNLELGRDADTGGQVLYVLELARYLSELETVAGVDLFTRLIVDKTVPPDYSQPIEKISDKCRIIRIRCGGRKYMRKELLWPYLDEFVDQAIRFIKQEGRIPDIIHGHYADAAYVCGLLSRFFGVPFVFTGHSLGRSKQERLLQDGMKVEDIEKKFKIAHRIEVEEGCLEQADLIVVSTQQEIEKQYALYEKKDIPTFCVIPPGFDLKKFYPYYHQATKETCEVEMLAYAQASLREELARFWVYRDRPFILTICRPERRKNISGLIKAYGEDRELQAIANLAIFAGIRKNITEKEENERDVLTEMLLLMDKYDLYGKMAIPKTHDSEYEIPELYHIVAEQKGVFVNVALIEPFGLTLIEAAATGVPVVATNDGGPRDIVKNLENGILVDPINSEDISAAIKKIITNPEVWKEYSRNGIMRVRKYYTWDAHVETYATKIKNLSKATPAEDFYAWIPDRSVGECLTRIPYLLICDIDNTLIAEGGNNEYLEELIHLLKENNKTIGFGVASGRTVDSAVNFLKRFHMPTPGLIISSVGSEIYYGKKRFYDQGWASHLGNKWNPEKIRTILKKLNYLEYQEESVQRKFKISYFMEPSLDRIAEIHHLLSSNKCKYSLIYSDDRFLDVLPHRASKGKAVRYISYKWGIPLDHILTCGDSGNDEDMLRGDTLGIVVGSHSPDLKKLEGLRNIYFARENLAGGILEGIKYYSILEEQPTYKGNSAWKI